MLKYLHEHGCPWDKTACKVAVVRNNLEALKYLREYGCPWDERTSDAARGELRVWVIGQGCPFAIQPRQRFGRI